jgi:hypothetical protein
VFIAAQAGGGIAGVLLIRFLYPALTPAQATAVVVPHEADNGLAAADGARTRPISSNGR